MKAKIIVRMMLLFLAISMVALPTYPQGVAPWPSPQFMRVATSGEAATVTYDCIVTTKDSGVEKTIVQAASEDAAKMAATQKFGSRAIGLKGVSCARTTGSAISPGDSSAQEKGVKTRASPPSFLDAIRPEVAFEPDGSCRLSQQAIVARPDARDHCQGYATPNGVEFVCPVKYCETLRPK
jgi:hypothetical protein